MAEQSLEERISALEAQLGDKLIEQRFREQADGLDSKLDAKLKPLRYDLAIIRHAVGVMLATRGPVKDRTG
jgi:hypothetical protein